MAENLDHPAEVVAVEKDDAVTLVVVAVVGNGGGEEEFVAFQDWVAHGFADLGHHQADMEHSYED